MPSLKLMAILAHPDDESLGVGGTLARYAAEGVEVSLVTATRGQAGRYRGHARDSAEHPGRDALARIREGELRAAAAALGVRDLSILDYEDGALDAADPRRIIADIAGHLRRVRPQVVVTFAPDGAYGHPDHIAVSQFAQAAVVSAADSSFAVSKLYYIAWPRAHWKAAWRAVSCHELQIAAFERLRDLSPASHEALWGSQCFYRVFSMVNGGRQRETDLFEGLR